MRRLGENAPKTELLRLRNESARLNPASAPNGELERGRHFEYLREHVERFAGPVDNILIGDEEDIADIDILHVLPNERTGCHLLVTSGMSDEPYRVAGNPVDPDHAYVELSVCLPPDWPLNEHALLDDRYYWPIGLLKMLAQLPHVFGCGLWAPDVVPNCSPLEPYAENTCLCGAMLTPPFRFASEFGRVMVDEPGVPSVALYNVLPLLEPEIAFQREHGPAALLRRLEVARHNGLVNPYRAPVV